MKLKNAVCSVLICQNHIYFHAKIFFHDTAWFWLVLIINPKGSGSVVLNSAEEKYTTVLISFSWHFCRDWALDPRKSEVIIWALLFVANAPSKKKKKNLKEKFVFLEKSISILTCWILCMVWYPEQLCQKFTY